MISRRHFLKLSSVTGGGLLLSIMLPNQPATGAAISEMKMHLHPCIRIDTTGRVFIKLCKQETGQGNAMIAAEEMDADWNQVEVDIVDFDKNVPGIEGEFNRFDAGESHAVESEWGDPMHKAGVTVRELLRRVAADHGELSIDDVTTDAWEIVNRVTGKRLERGALTEAAEKPDIPEFVFEGPSGIE
jgi:isoquinoline 1-oxidoreductase subunit beta